MTLTDAFWKIHEGLPRQAPGSDSSTRNMLRLAGGADKFKRALDIGYSTGRSAIVLAEQNINVTAVITIDTLALQLEQAATEKDLLPMIEIKKADIHQLPFAPESFDLLWAEGSIYAVGFEYGLENWANVLKPGGVAVVTDCAWLTTSPAEETKNFWTQAYPAILKIPSARHIAESCGFEVLHTYILSDADWFEEYYKPLEKRHDDLRNETNPVIRQAIEIGKAEIALRETHYKEYGYVGFILKKR